MNHHASDRCGNPQSPPAPPPSVGRGARQLIRTGGFGLLLGLVLVTPSHAARAQEFRLNAEGAGGFWVDQPQENRFTPGLYLAVRPGIALGRVVTLQASYAMFLTPPGDGFTDTGTSHSAGLGVRLRPLATFAAPEDQLAGLFVDGNASYVRTGELDRFGFDAGLGYNVQATPWMALGPVLRYNQIVQPDDTPGQSAEDAQYLTLGLNLSFGPAWKAAEAAPAHVDTPCPTCEVMPVAVVAPPCSDHDQDGTCDTDDLCPTKLGPAAAFGCPIDPCGGEPLVVLVQFPYDSAELPKPVAGNAQTMDPVLDAVAAAIAQDPTCRVCIIGHSSEEGTEAYNLDLSRRRAGAVKDYLGARGLATARMPVTGMGESCQLIPASTRTLNRRVEFHRLQEGESCPAQCRP